MRERLRALLAPRGGERILEVGAGRGEYALRLAGDVAPGGSIDVVDAHPQMLDATVRGARERGLENVAAVLGDPRRLPFDDNRFDAAYLVAALGDAQDARGALAELARVVRPGGRIVVGELHGDPHHVGPAALRECCARAGLAFARWEDTDLGYLAVLEPQRRVLRAAR